MRVILVFLVVMILSLGRSFGFQVADITVNSEKLYNELNLEGTIDYDVYQKGFDGLVKLGMPKDGIFTIIDFTKPSAKERFYVLDVFNKELLYKTHVAHGKNSGNVYATSFSNVNGSNKSSLGFFKTGGTYYGGSGYSLYLDGVEKGINDNVRMRNIVIHGSKYVNSTIAQKQGKIGRSLGCPALPQALNRQIIDVIKGGSVLYIHGNDDKYFANSPVLNSPYINELT